MHYDTKMFASLFRTISNVDLPIFFSEKEVDLNDIETRIKVADQVAEFCR
jgi:hypothetical protein